MRRKKHALELLPLSVSPIGRPSAISFRPCSATADERWWTSLVKFAEPMHEARAWIILRFRRMIWWKSSSFSFCTDVSLLHKVWFELPRVFFFERTRGSFRWCSVGVERRAAPPRKDEQGAHRIVPGRREGRNEGRAFAAPMSVRNGGGNNGTRGKWESESGRLILHGVGETKFRREYFVRCWKFTLPMWFTGYLSGARMHSNGLLNILVRIFARNRDEKRGRSRLLESAYTIRRFFAMPITGLTYILYIIG